MKKLFFLFLGIATLCQAQEQDPDQDPARFKDEVQAIQEKYRSKWNPNMPTIVFTGSSSIRLWVDLEERFPEHQILNTAFGGSQTSDLIVYLNEVVLSYKPEKVFIYEGDNDISFKKRKREIVRDITSVVSTIKTNYPESEIVLISPKPSITRWHWKGRYKRLNKKLLKFTEEADDVSFVDVWHPMLNGRKLNESLFIEDGLHMNSEGYDIWYNALKEHMD